MGLMAIISAQSPSIETFCHKYNHLPEATSLSISGSFLGTMLAEDGYEEEVDRIFSMRIFSTREDRQALSRRDINALQHGMRREGFEQHLVVNENGKEVKFLVKKQGDQISELSLIVDEPEEFALISFYGEIDPCRLANMCKDLDVNGEQYMRHLAVCN